MRRQTHFYYTRRFSFAKAFYLPPVEPGVYFHALRHQSKPPVERVVCTTPIRGYYWRTPCDRGYRMFDNALLSLTATHEWLFIFAYLFLFPVNGSIYSFKVNWSYALSSSNWFCMYSDIIFLFFPTVST